MLDRDAAPTLVQIVGADAPVALVRLVLAAQQARAIEQLRRERLLDPALRQQAAKCALVCRPAALLPPVIVEHGLRRRELESVQVVRIADRPREVTQVVPLREPG